MKTNLITLLGCKPRIESYMNLLDQSAATLAKVNKNGQWPDDNPEWTVPKENIANELNLMELVVSLAEVEWSGTTPIVRLNWKLLLKQQGHNAENRKKILDLSEKFPGHLIIVGAPLQMRGHVLLMDLNGNMVPHLWHEFEVIIVKPEEV